MLGASSSWDKSHTTADLTALKLCPQVQPLDLGRHTALYGEVVGLYEDTMYKAWAYESLSQAIRIPTVTEDGIGPPGQDRRWESRLELHRYLEERYPLMHSSLKRTVLNQFALVYEWRGADRSLKPILLTAHQDTIPVDPESEEEWIHQPFSGYVDGEWIWGRGAVDGKATLGAIFIAIESLLSKGFKPERTIVLAFGMDAEQGGIYGGPAIRNFLLSRYRPNGFSFVLGEGDGFSERSGIKFATPGVAEKGKLNLNMEIKMNSSPSRRRNAISLLSLVISSLESTTFPTHLRAPSPTFANLQCLTAHDPDFPEHLKELVMRATSSENAGHQDDTLSALDKALLRSDESKWGEWLGSTKNVNLVSGGAKVGVAARRARAVVETEVVDWSSVYDVQTTYIALLSPLAAYLNLSFSAFDHTTVSPYQLDVGAQNIAFAGHLAISDFKWSATNPTPTSPTTGGQSGAWQFLSGAIQGALVGSNVSGTDGQNIVVQPGLNLRTTETHWYTDLSPFIFRYAHRSDNDTYNGTPEGLHDDVNEAIRAESFLEMSTFFVRLILGADDTELLGRR
ncbi:carboxypeptidase S [Stereum hirsutum FP-91666 SS1]|uniref:carboxypeptidase S n=1 Tax=Stereum hirsutum (strain FP-91666) TaxID=721885 RepID=UPI000444988A|nr:carboxypeptidase S [Stereum hirsutum FP-91666 SS1]EIM80897.1 carboxypeptidase S [Stereum hirsutum FP-91666 SS1]